MIQIAGPGELLCCIADSALPLTHKGNLLIALNGFQGNQQASFSNQSQINMQYDFKLIKIKKFSILKNKLTTCVAPATVYLI